MKRTLTTLTLLLAGTVSQADTIIYFDDFTGADGTAILGLTPDTNNGVAGATFHESDNVWSPASVISGNRGQLGADNRANLAIASAGGFVQPEQIRVSAIMNVGTTGAGAGRGVGLGFWASNGFFSVQNGFRGLMITPDGRLIFAEQSGGGASEIAEIATGLNAANDHTVSFEINTTSGDLSNILLNGVLQSDVTTTLFASDVNHVGFFTSSSAGGTTAQFDDFTVTEVPEPGSLALLGLGGLLFARRRRG